MPLERWLALALLLVLLATGAVLGRRMAQGRWLETSLSALLPSASREPRVQAAFNAFRAVSERRVLLMLGHAERDRAKLAAGRMVQALARMPGIASVRGPLDERAQQSWVRLYGPIRQQFLAPPLRALLEQRRGQEWARQVVAQAYSPFGAVGSRELHADPFLLLRQYLLAVGAGPGTAQIDEGWPLYEDAQGRWNVLVTAELAIDPYSVVPGRELVERIAGLADELVAHEPGLLVTRQGAVFYAAAGSRGAIREVSTIGVGSMLGVIVLVVLVFRSAWPLLLVVLSILCGLIAGAGVTLLLTGPMHLFSLIFGSSLVGVTVDYAFHYLCGRFRTTGHASAQETVRAIRPAIAMSLVTSAMSYLALFVAPFPALQQIALFSATGLVVAFGIVVLWFPLLAPRLHRHALPLGGAFARWLGGWERLGARRWLVALALGLPALALAASMHADDDVRQMQAVPPQLAAQERHIFGLVGLGTGVQVLLVHADAPQALLARVERTTARLERAVAEGALGGYRSIERMLPSLERQREDRELVRTRLLRPWFPLLAESLGLPHEIGATLLAQPFVPLLPEPWLASPASEGWRNLWLQTANDGVYAMIVLQGVRARDALLARTAGLEEVHYLNVAEDITHILHVYRVRIGYLIVLAYVLILALLVWRYGWRWALRIVLPPVTAALAGLALLAAVGHAINFFSLFAVVLVLGLGIDYALFFAESRGNLPATMLAVSLAAMTTLLSFGLLALSSTAAIANFGLVVFGGVITAFLLAPIAGFPSPAQRSDAK